MKDLSEISKNINRNNLTEHKESIVIDDFAKSIIDRVFNNLAIIFPAWKHNWKSDDPNDPDKVLRSAKREWTKAFVENNISTMEQISYGFAKARKSETDFLPSCGKFISWCSPSPEDLGYPTEQQAMSECVKHRNNAKLFGTTARPFIVELCKRVDWWLITTACTQVEHKKADKHFKDEYLNLINSDYREPEETSGERLETSEVVSDRMSPQQKEDAIKRGKDCVEEVKRKLSEHRLNKEK